MTADREREVRNRVVEAIVSSHGSIPDPDFRFIRKRYEKRLHRAVVDDLLLRYFVRETTDLNSDCSVALAVQTDEGLCGVYLSLVGAFAVLSKAGPLLEEHDISEGSAAFKLRSVIECHGVEVLYREFLRETISFGNKQEPTTLYEILFSEDYAVFLDKKDREEPE